MRRESGGRQIQELEQPVNRVVERLVLIVQSLRQITCIGMPEDLLASGNMGCLDRSELLNIGQKLLSVVLVPLFFSLWNFLSRLFLLSRST